MRVNSVMAPYRGRSFFFYNYFYSNNIDFLQSNSQTNHFSLTGCCSWRLPASCLLSREDTFMLIPLSCIAAFINRCSCKFCFQPVILVTKGEQQSLAQWTDWRHVSVAFLTIYMASFGMVSSRCLSVPCLSASSPYNWMCFAFQYSVCFVTSLFGIFLNRHSLWAATVEPLESQNWRHR